MKETRREFIRARLAAPGVRRTADGQNGRSYLRLLLRVDVGRCEQSLEGALRDHLGATEHDDLVFYFRIEPLQGATRAAIADAFDTEVELRASEAEAIDDLASALHHAMSQHRVHAFLVQTGWADAVGSAYHGTLLVDPAAGEALWTFTEEVWNES